MCLALRRLVANGAARSRATGSGDDSRSLHGFPIPTGLCLSAQGCEERATLGTPAQASPTPTGLRPCPLFSSRSAATLSGLYSLCRFPQGSSFLATLGFVSESLWDSPSFWMPADLYKERDKSPHSKGLFRRFMQQLQRVRR